MNEKYCCWVNAVEYHEPVTDDEEGQYQQCPFRMHGIFQYDGFEPFVFEVIFDPMGGFWTLIKVNGRLRVLTKANEMRYRQISRAAMRIACHNRAAVNPDEFKWQLTHNETTIIS